MALNRIRCTSVRIRRKGDNWVVFRADATLFKSILKLTHLDGDTYTFSDTLLQVVSELLTSLNMYLVQKATGRPNLLPLVTHQIHARDLKLE
jgi:hypothetical protein